MPCNSDYLDPTSRESELQRAAQLLVFVHKKLGEKPPAYAVEDAKNIYCHRDSSVIALCDILHHMSDEEMDKIVYDARDKTSRDLANWWEDHQEADRKRIAEEENTKNRAKEKRRKQYEELKKEFGEE